MYANGRKIELRIFTPPEQQQQQQQRSNSHAVCAIFNVKRTRKETDQANTIANLYTYPTQKLFSLDSSCILFTYLSSSSSSSSFVCATNLCAFTLGTYVVCECVCVCVLAIQTILYSISKIPIYSVVATFILATFFSRGICG